MGSGNYNAIVSFGHSFLKNEPHVEAQKFILPDIERDEGEREMKRRQGNNSGQGERRETATILPKRT